MGKKCLLAILVTGASLSPVAFSKDALHMSATPNIPGLHESGKPDEKTGVVEFGEVKPPKLVKAVTPYYPPEARRLGFEGKVIIEATTDLKGRVRKTRVLRSVPLLDEPAVKAIRQWVFEPLVINDRPRPVVFTVTIGFSLHSGATDKGLSDIEPPKLMTRVVPVYPPEAKKAGIEGTVILAATIDGEGKVTQVKVLDSAPGLDQAAVDAIKQWVYAPVWVNNHPVIYTFTIFVKFALKPGKN